MSGKTSAFGIVTAAAVAVAIGLLPMPYGYYMLLRLFLCGVCVYFITALPAVRDGEKWVLGGLVVLYNPLVPVTLGSKLLWTVINIATVAFFLALQARRPSSNLVQK